MKILFLQKRLLFPADTGGKIRTLNLLRHLAAWHEVTYLCNISIEGQPYRNEMLDLGLRLETIPWQEAHRGSARFYLDVTRNLFSRFPYTVDKDYDLRLKARAAQIVRCDRVDLVVCDFVQMARNAWKLSGVPKLLFQHNVESEILARHAADNPNWLVRRFFALQQSRMERFEAAAGKKFDTVVAVSRRDKDLFEKLYGWRHVQHINTAVDLDYLAPKAPDCDQPPRVAFIGSLDWLPNSEGVCWFVRETWPRIRSRVENAEFEIVGRNPPSALQALEEVEGVKLIGHVPDVRPYLARASVIVVPLLVGGGTRLKIVEAMAAGKPVVSTTIGAEGLEVTADRNIVLADDPDGIASAVSELFQDRDRRVRLGREARRFVEEECDSRAVARHFERICLDLVARSESCPADGLDRHRDLLGDNELKRGP